MPNWNNQNINLSGFVHFFDVVKTVNIDAKGGFPPLSWRDVPFEEDIPSKIDRFWLRENNTVVSVAINDMDLARLLIR